MTVGKLKLREAMFPFKHRINADNKASKAKDDTVASIFDNKFRIPLDFEILESSLPFLSVWFRQPINIYE